MSELLVVQVDAAVAAYVAKAIVDRGKLLRSRDEPAPDGLAPVLAGFVAATYRQLPTDEVARVATWLETLDDDRALLVTIGEAAKLLAVSPRQIERMLAAGKLTPIRLGGATRLARSQLEQIIARQLNPAQEKEAS